MTEITKISEPEIRYIERFPFHAFSSFGRVVSFTRKKPFQMKGMPVGRYLAVSLVTMGGRRERIYVHRAIAEAFHGPCPDGMQCRHLDGNSHNNRPENLAWGDVAENAFDRVRHKTACIGERHGCAKLTKESVREMRAIKAATDRSFRDIADEYGVSPMTAHRAITGKLWRNV